MTEQELAFIIAEGEGLFVEFKQRPDAAVSGGRIA
jgi:hypothetical protein